MRFHHERFFNAALECFLLRAIHDLDDAPPFASYTLYGSDLDRPERLDLYRGTRPAHDEHPVAIYDRAGQVLRLRARPDTPTA